MNQSRFTVTNHDTGRLRSPHVAGCSNQPNPGSKRQTQSKCLAHNLVPRSNEIAQSAPLVYEYIICPTSHCTHRYFIRDVSPVVSRSSAQLSQLLSPKETSTSCSSVAPPSPKGRHRKSRLLSDNEETKIKGKATANLPHDDIPDLGRVDLSIFLSLSALLARAT